MSALTFRNVLPTVIEVIKSLRWKILELIETYLISTRKSIDLDVVLHFAIAKSFSSYEASATESTIDKHADAENDVILLIIFCDVDFT